ncbi:MAG: cytochrome c-type biogenesis protein CcmH [Anaerolineales bacterium]|nr:cytochrome c-type biogenesis protein CcmH [Anaerolineales bacterium]
MKKIYPLMLIVVVFLLSLFLVSTVAAQGGGGTGVTDDQVNEIASQLFCPVCENTPLDVCETQACKQWRELIRLQISEGKTEAEIKQYFVDNYGARVLAEPPREGFSLLVYFVPPLIIFAGAVILFRAFKQWKKEDEISVEAGAGPTSTDAVNDPDAAYIARLEEEMRKRD